MSTPLERYEYYAARVDRINAARARHLYLSLGVVLVIGLGMLAAVTNASHELDRPGASDNVATGATDDIEQEGSVYYRNCAEARAAGVAPIYEGEPGYRSGLDGDSDGIACEPYHPR